MESAIGVLYAMVRSPRVTSGIDRTDNVPRNVTHGKCNRRVVRGGSQRNYGPWTRDISPRDNLPRTRGGTFLVAKVSYGHGQTQVGTLGSQSCDPQILGEINK